MTRLYMAESFLEDGKREEAKKQLEWVVSHSPDLLPEALPENRLYQRQARELLQKEFGG
jgi:predicted negative regulator of RcsB-dependent stress response